MRKIRDIILLLILFSPPILCAGPLEDARFFEKIYLAVAIRVETIPTSTIGTGFLTKLEREPTKLVFTTNKHMVEGANELKLTVPIKDTSKIIIDTITINVPLFKDKVKQYYIPDESLDIAFLIIDKTILHKADPKLDIVRFSSLPYSVYTSIKNLFAGQSVLFTGYPLGLTVNRTQPLLRKGSIAGIDTIRGVIYLDADAFGGSSGSPVFIDFSSQTNIEFWNTYEQMLVGIIAGYLPFEKRLVNIETGRIEMVQTENSGIAVVVPAETIRKMAERFLADFK